MHGGLKQRWVLNHLRSPILSVPSQRIINYLTTQREFSERPRVVRCFLRLLGPEFMLELWPCTPSPRAKVLLTCVHERSLGTNLPGHALCFWEMEVKLVTCGSSDRRPFKLIAFTDKKFDTSGKMNHIYSCGSNVHY